MIYVLCSGGLGNQMFQYALYRSLVAAGKQAIFDTSYYNGKSEKDARYKFFTK